MALLRRRPSRRRGRRTPPTRRAQRPAAQTAIRRAPPRRRRRGSSDLGARILVAVPAVIVVIALIDVGRLAWALFLIALGVICLHELYRLLAAWKPIPIIGFAALVGMVLAARYGSPRVVLEVAAGVVPALFLAVLVRGQHERATLAVASTLLGVWWIALAIAHAELLRRLPHGGAILFDVLAGTFLGDTGAYLGGRLFGRRLLAPSISPNKTFEGLFCGGVVAILTLVLAGTFQNTWMTNGHALLLGVAVAVLGPLGDLFESLIKRDAQAKDTGGLFGAHGGALDRADAALFTVLGGYYIWFAIVR